MAKFGCRLCATLVFGLLTLSAHATPKTLRVVADNNYPPYLLLGADGQPEGYSVDLWKLWEKKTGVRVDLEPMRWSSAQRAMHDGKADVIDMIFRTPVRDQLYTFSPPYATQVVGIYVDHTIHGIHDVRSLKGFEIGVERGDACIDKLTSLGITHLVAYPNYEAILAAAKSGVIKMFCMDDNPANYYLYLNRKQLQFTRAFTLYKGRLHWAVSRGDTATFALVARGMNMITPAERSALRRKWLSHPISFRPYVRAALIVTLGLLGALSVLALWIWILRRAVRARTSEIHEKNALLEEQAHELVIEQAQLRTLVESSPDAMWLKDRHGKYLECNAHASRLLGLVREKVIGRRDIDLVADAGLVARMREMDRRVRATGEPQNAEFTITLPDGTPRNMELTKVPVQAPDGQLSGVFGVARDVTERRHAEHEQRIAAAAFESQDGIVVSDAEGNIQRVNAAFTTLTGFAPGEAIGRTLKSLIRSGIHSKEFYAALDGDIASTGNWRGEVWYRKKNGALSHGRLTISAVHDDTGMLRHTVCSMHDITAETEARKRAEHLTKVDLLTNLPNRMVIEKHTGEAISGAGNDDQCRGALLLIGLDDFSIINNVHGHQFGDRVILEATQRMRRLTPKSGTLGRFGGDEFVLLIAGDPETVTAISESASELGQALCDALARPYDFADVGEVICTASIGVTLLGSPYRPVDALLGEAGLAMSRAKMAGKNTVRLFAAEMQKEIEARNAMASDLRAGMASGQFTLHYQAQCDATGKMVGAEALLRWNHPSGKQVPPAEFIPVAEQTGLIESLGSRVLEQACRTLTRWTEIPAAQHLTLSVNVSPRQFRQADFVDRVKAALAGCGTASTRLKLEITESMAMEDIEGTINKLGALKRLGVRISLDDFGTGSSALSYLTRLPLDQLKIDKSFVRNLPDAWNDAHVAQTIIAMARGMGLEVVAEGVEKEEQFLFLKAEDCDLYQGYFIGKPLPLREFEHCLDSLWDTATVSP